MTEKKGATATSLSLLGEGKSKRLQEMQRKAMGLENSKTELKAVVRDKQTEQSVDSALQHAREVIDRRLNEILAVFPANKRQRYFVIRFGMSVEQLKELPIEEIFDRLQVKQNFLPAIRGVANLDYNGQPAQKGSRGV